jgi:transposase-like protein
MGKRKVPITKVIEAVEKWIAGEGSQRSLAAEIGIDSSTFRTYLARYRNSGIGDFIGEANNRVYSTELKLKAIAAYKNGEGSFRSIASKYGLRSETQLKKWIEVYNSGEGFRRKMSGGSRMKETRSTTVEERIQIAKDCIANGGNYGETALKYNVSYQQVYQWVKKYKEKGEAGLEDRRGKRLKDQTPRTREEELEIEVAKLKHELYMTQMERDLLKKLDEIERREAYRK